MISVVAAIVIAALVERVLARRGRALDRTPVLATRLRFGRRALEAAIILVGVAIALSQFEALDRIAATVLASSAITAAVVGFAARQTLANAVAGLLLAVSQPIRVGDHVSFEEHDGEVEDVRLTYTYLRTAAGARVVIPNERLAGGVLRNDTILDPQVSAEADLWLAPEADARAAVGTVQEGVPGAEAAISEVTVEGTRLTVTGERGDAATRGARASALRAAAYGALRDAGLR